MAWTSPSTAVAGTILTAATWNAQVRSNMQALLPLDTLAWTSYTPTLTQSGTVTKTVTRAKYQRTNNTVIVEVILAVTGTGTGANAVTVSLPVTAATAGSAVCGIGVVFDSSASLSYPGVALRTSTTVISFQPTTSTAGGFLGSSQFTAALDNGDSISCCVEYEV